MRKRQVIGVIISFPWRRSHTQRQGKISSPPWRNSCSNRASAGEVDRLLIELERADTARRPKRNSPNAAKDTSIALSPSSTIARIWKCAGRARCG